MKSFGNRALIILCLVLSLGMLDMHVADDGPEAVLFIFGDSIVDVGTNNFLNTKAKANVEYNGIDFPFSEATGRFSNGLNTADHIARLFGYKRSPPPFLALQQRQFSFKRNILRGVNFASGGSGILSNTGQQHWGKVIPLEDQVQQFAMVRGKMSETMTPPQTADFLSKALFLISVGSNDLFEFFVINDKSLAVDQYLGTLLLNYYLQIEILYELGARKFGIIGIPPVGCCPAARAINYKRSGQEESCVQNLNHNAEMFHSALRSLLQNITSQLKGFKYSLGNSYAMTNTMLEDPLVFGFKNTDTACCGHGKFNGEDGCIKSDNTELCEDRRDHLFWDFYHPTDKASELAALSFYGGGRSLVYPRNFSQLAQLDV